MQANNLKLLGDYHSTLLPLREACDPIVAIALLSLLNQLYGVPFTTPYILLAALTFLLAPSIFKAIGLYRADQTDVLIAQSSRILIGWGIVLALLFLLGYLTHSSDYFSHKLLLTWAISVPIGLYIFHLNLRVLLHQLRASGCNARTAVIAGASEAGFDLATQIRKSPQLGINLHGFFASATPSTAPPAVGKLLGTLEDLPEYVRRHRIDVVYIVMSMNSEETLSTLMNELQDTTACVYFVPNVLMFSLMRDRTHEINGIPLIAAWTVPFSGVQYVLKRTVDVVVAGLAIALLSPLMLLIAVGVKLSSPGSVLFKQRRYGLNGQEILVYKFRSMTVMENGEKVVQAKQNDPRITKFGAFLRRTSLDELPQFINVLQGRMSIVGPRPHAVFHNEQYRKLINGYMLRHKVKPGITGWAQVNGFRGETDTLEKMKQRVEYDLQYLKNWSLGLDLSIIFRTALVFFHSRNAY